MKAAVRAFPCVSVRLFYHGQDEKYLHFIIQMKNNALFQR